MRLPILLVADALNAELPEINWFVNQVDESQQVNPTYPLGRIVEIGGDYGFYSSENPNYLLTSVQVDVWVKDMKQLEEYYFKLDEIMRADNVQCDYTEQTQDHDLKDARRIIKRYTISQRVI